MDWSKTTFAFVREMEEFLGKMNKEQLAHKLSEFGFSSQAKDLQDGNMEEEDARHLLFTAYDVMRSNDLAKERHRRKHDKKRRK